MFPFRFRDDSKVLYLGTEVELGDYPATQDAPDTHCGTQVQG